MFPNIKQNKLRQTKKDDIKVEGHLNYTTAKKIRFFLRNAFFYSALVLLDVSLIELQMLLRCCLVHISIIILRHFFIYYFVSMSRPRVIYVSYLCDLFFIFIFIFIMINGIIPSIQTHLLFCFFFRFAYFPIIFGWSCGWKM